MTTYLFFDIDNTLRSKRTYEIPKSTYALIKALKKKGYKMGIATGRGLYSARMFAQELDMDFVVSDGGRCVLLDDKIIYTNPISEKTIDQVVQFALTHDIPIGYSNHFAIHSTSDVFMKAFDLDQTILCSVKKEIEISKLFGLTKMYLWADRELIETNELFLNIEHHWLREKLCVIEHRHKDEGIKILQKHLNIAKEAMIAFGDDINDITMFQHCNLSVCLGNGTEEAKKFATYIADDIDKDGLLKACLDLKLIQKEDLL